MDKQTEIDAILASYCSIGGTNTIEGKTLPSRESINKMFNLVKSLLFPGYFEKSTVKKQDLEQFIGQKVDALCHILSEELCNSFCWQDASSHSDDNEAKAKGLSLEFIQYIPELRQQLTQDIQATYDGDPAATNLAEVILAYPGFHAVIAYRVAHFIFKQGVPLIPRLLSELCHSETGIDIHPGATIGTHFCIDHGTGLVVGETTVIGNHVKLYQGVTLGALSITDRTNRTKRHPTVEDNVTVYARTTILGGRTVIGKNTIVGGNLWILNSIPANSKVYRSVNNDHHIETS